MGCQNGIVGVNISADKGGMYLMQFFKFGKEVGQHLTMYDSDFVMSRIAITNQRALIGCMFLEKDGVIGYHEATVPQLLLVIQGEGWVRSGENEKVYVTAGDAVFWEMGEGHETTTETGITAFVIESEELNPGYFLQVKND